MISAGINSTKDVTEQNLIKRAKVGKYRLTSN